MKYNQDILFRLFQAYFNARKNKRSKHSQLAFEWQLEQFIFELYDEVVSKKYQPGNSICFIVEEPVKREVFAADFRDRIVHHFIYNILSPLAEKIFLYDVYSRRKQDKRNAVARILSWLFKTPQLQKIRKYHATAFSICKT